jgi:hypothetical protein
MNPIRFFLFSLVLAVALQAQSFDPSGWRGYRALNVVERSGIARTNDPVELEFAVEGRFDLENPSLRLVEGSGASLQEVPAQFFELEADGAKGIRGRVVFLARVSANAERTYRLYHGHPTAGLGQYRSKLTVRQGTPGPVEGPMHWLIENDFYRIETYPKNGQIWHIWNRQGADKMWWFKEWHDLEQGGDPVHWSPNVWVAYPDRIRNGTYNAIDWHYAVGWSSPETEIITGPIFHQIRRRGPVPPHPERAIDRERPKKDIVWAEVTYRFYGDLPWFYQSSTLKTLDDLSVYFIRNNQMVFHYSFFSHLAIRPDTPGLLPGDHDETAVLPLMSHLDRAAFAVDHTLSNIVPSKLGFYAYFNPESGDGYANIPLLERNSTESGAAPTMTNHAMSFTERHGWVVYFGRTFNYTNQRYDPENAVFLPGGQIFEEANAHLIYRYENEQSLRSVENLQEQLKHPLEVVWRK